MLEVKRVEINYTMSCLARSCDNLKGLEGSTYVSSHQSFSFLLSYEYSRDREAHWIMGKSSSTFLTP